jgi:hypothetical protein
MLTVKGKAKVSNGEYLKEAISQNCNYLKNKEGYLIVISNKEYKTEVFDQILSTFRFD